jgi:hypothetical protein
MKAIEEEMVAGMAKSNGCTWMLTAQVASIGSSMESVATFEVSSVRKVTLRQIIMIRKSVRISPRA